MDRQKEPTVIKKYANRRLYHTGTSTYVTLDDLAEMVKAEEDFVVIDAKSSEDITRSVLTQIIFEQENRGPTNLLPVNFLRQLIRFYGDSMQTLVPSYLDYSMSSLAREQGKFREQMAKALGQTAFDAMEEQVRRNMAMFDQTLRMFSPFGAPARDAGKDVAAKPKDAGATPATGSEIDELKKQLSDVQSRLEKLSRKD